MSGASAIGLAKGASVYDDLGALLDERTLEILARRRSTRVVRRRGWLVRRMLLLADVVGIVVAFMIAHAAFPDAAVGGAMAGTTQILVFVATLPLWVVLAKIYRLYDRDEGATDYSTTEDLTGVFHLVTTGAWLLLVGGLMTDIARPGVAKIVAFWALAVATITLSRAGARAFSRRRIAYLQNTVIVGAGDVGQTVARKFLQHPEYGINLVGFVDAAPKERRNGLRHIAILGPPAGLPELVRMFDIERVVIAFSHDSHENMLGLIRELKDLEVQVDIVPRLFEIVGAAVDIHTVEGVPLVGIPPFRLSRSSRLLKRVMDLVLATAGVVVLAPLFLVIGALIKLDSPGPIFFRQVRMGSGERTFRIFKFRTMVEDADERKHEIADLNMHATEDGDPRMFKIPDDPRLTRVGRFLRRYSLDELPQLINILKGEMSLVGPRPLVLDEDQHVTQWARKRLALKPGATGLWQVLGASDIPFHEMTKLDYLYVTNWSLSGDLRLIFRTLPALLRARRAY